ncbi:MAG: hypothetical protein EOM87_00895 [Clostridia bacterium]|nr:hypothetical protein [Clostridia bacterium]
MLKKRILILSGNNYRGVLKLSYLENAYLDIEFNAHFLPACSYWFVIKIGEYTDYASFNGEKLIRKNAVTLDFDSVIHAAVIDAATYAILLSASTSPYNTSNYSYLINYVKSRTAVPEAKPDKKPAKKLTEAEITAQPKEKKDDKPQPDNSKETNGLMSEAFKKSVLEELKKSSAAETGFFDSIKESVFEFFEKYPPCEELMKIVPSSKWVKVDTEDTYYVVGLLFNTSGITHICYGIPGEYTVKPPSDILTEWLPLNPEEWEKSGYWMIYQNAETGLI